MTQYYRARPPPPLRPLLLREPLENPPLEPVREEKLPDDLALEAVVIALAAVLLALLTVVFRELVMTLMLLNMDGPLAARKVDQLVWLMVDSL